MEACVGCGALDIEHPWVGVGTVTRGPRVKFLTRMASYPVCDACWRAPSHRSKCGGLFGVTMKLHYFPKAQERQALAMAGSGHIG